ncbi:hypothetical protein XENOCAPTIV_008010 [Xenoophorus captivus]|uniref:Uncharacterized protein n=1 Tax=Xenoophorus captivus TaxID=1517983 RepID=A0ABV0QH43_9TELE
MPSKYLNIFMTYSESVGNKKDYFVCFLLPCAEEKLSSWSNVQVYWSLVMSCPCDWDVANSEEKTRNGYSSLLLNTTHTHTHTHHDIHQYLWSSAAPTVFAMYKQY